MKESNLKTRLREVMEERDLRQTDVVAAAEKYREAHPEYQDVELRRNDISQYLSKEIEPKPDKLRLLANTLGVTSDWLRGYDHPKTILEETLYILGYTITHVEDKVCVADDADPCYHVNYTPAEWRALSRMNDVNAVMRDVRVAAEQGAEDRKSALSDRAVRVGILYDRADARDQKLVDTVLEPYDDGTIPAQAIPIKKTPAPAQEIAYPKIKHRSDGFCEITVYEDQLPAAGPSSYFDAPRSHIEQYPQGIIPQGATFAVPIAGNSMEPKFKNGATVFVQSAPRVENGEVGLFSLNGEPYIKQLVVDEARHEVRLHSLNPAYQDIEIHEGDYLYTFGRVLGSYPV